MAYNYPNFFQYGQNMPMQQSQSNGFVLVRSEMEARNFPVGFGNSVMFKDETAPYLYSKTMGFSQLDKPIFEKYKLVKEEIKENIVEPVPVENYRKEFDSIWAEIKSIKEKQNEQYNELIQSVHAKSDEISDDAV